MRLFPTTLLGRTACYLSLLLLASNLLWFTSTGQLLVKPVGEGYVDQLCRTVVAVHEMVAIRLQKQPAFQADFALPASLDPCRIVADRAVPALELRVADPFLVDVTRILTAKLGTGVKVGMERASPWIWVRFPAGDGWRWLGLPVPRRPSITTALVVNVSIWLTATAVGAYLIIYRLTRRLRTVTLAARSVGRGEVMAPLPEGGSQEVRDLSAAFNQMTTNLQQLDADRRLMLAGISHDLRTPLTRLRLALEMLSGGSDPAAAAGIVQDLEDIDGILRQFLDYARDGSEEGALPGDLNAVLQEMIGRYTEAGIAIHFDPGSLPPVLFRPGALRRAVGNLLENAVRYGRSGISITTCREGDQVLFTVADRGPGSGDTEPGEFIKPFFRGNASRSETGAGLGLTIVDRIVRLHGGTLMLENRLGGGFVAIVSLPLSGR